MKIIVTYTDKGIVLGVESISRIKKTEEEIENIINQENSSFGYKKHEILTVPEELYSVFKFLLGKEEYATVPKLRKLYRVLDDIRDNIEGAYTEIFDLKEWADDLSSDFKELLGGVEDPFI